ncbi:TetR/AcrR family transcriptional regulator [Kineosporia sp. J2-2]|uniref:TetR/AcrR family transcriptional regulator n=1 Tax=Kineosporia corallincola TaxID=2835133 RepID=A0ABS5TMT8_9ACTN|nr:TetR/AcrR family transcriptional regulator [Kineosporia corallincola]MBT0772163.1 TetR/AcrR family transcriptional regulator [Kineosporia corallincola]
MTTETAKTAEPARLGRKRDHSRDPEILAAALDVLAEVGYDGMTVDMVAARAKAGKATLYRRWPSKAELVVDAVGCMKRPLHHDANGNLLVPDTGTLRGDLIAMVKPKAVTDGSRHLKIMLGVASMLSSAPELLDSINSIMIEPRTEAYRLVFERAVQRGEIKPGADVTLLASLGPALSMFRAVYQQQPPSRELFLHIIDAVILPAVGLSAPGEGAHE